MRTRAEFKERRRFPIVCVLLVTVTGGAFHSLAQSTDEVGGRITSTTSKILNLDDGEAQRLIRWLRRGGHLLVAGSAAETSLNLVLPGMEIEQKSARIGLGEITILDDMGYPPVESSRSEPCELLGAAERLVHSTLPSAEGLRLRTAWWLAGYGFILCVGFLLTPSFPTHWRVAGATSLVLAFGLWPWWGRAASWDTDRWNQVDVLVQIDDGPPLIWSVASLRAAGRRTIEFLPGAGAWNLALLREQGHVDPSKGGTQDAVEQEYPRLFFESTRGARMTLGWLADGGVTDRLLLEVTQRHGRRTSLVRNEFARSWNDAWLLQPGLAPRRLEALPPLGAQMVESHDSPPARENFGTTSVRAELSAKRSQLLAEAFKCAIDPMLERGLPVLIAWSEEPIRPARTGQGEALNVGTSLLIVAGRMEL